MRTAYVGFLGNEVFHVKLWQKYEEEEATDTKKKEVEVKVNLTPLNFRNIEKFEESENVTNHVWFICD